MNPTMATEFEAWGDEGRYAASPGGCGISCGRLIFHDPRYQAIKSKRLERLDDQAIAGD